MYINICKLKLLSEIPIKNSQTIYILIYNIKVEEKTHFVKKLKLE